MSILSFYREVSLPFTVSLGRQLRSLMNVKEQKRQGKEEGEEGSRRGRKRGKMFQAESLY